jgi:uridine kinase
MAKKGVLIGISGASGSGKTLIAHTICEELQSDQILNLQADAYYRDLSHLPINERTKINFDHPDAFDTELLVQHIKQLLDGKLIDHPIYDFTIHTRKKETKKVGPYRIIILDGILILSNSQIRELMDIKVFVDTPTDICLIRRLKRDITERGRSLDSVLEQYTETVRPMYYQYILPAKQYADIIIPHGGKNRTAIDILKSKIEKLID